MSRAQTIKDIRSIIGDVYYKDENRGAKTNELGMTKRQVIELSEEITDYIENQNKKGGKVCQ